MQQQYRERLELIGLGDSSNGNDDSSDSERTQNLVRELELRVLTHKREAVTRLRDANRIDDIVLREIQETMDAEEVRLLGPSPAD